MRLTCGLGLMLLPAVQQKLCTLPVPDDPAPISHATPTPASEDESKQKTKTPLTLAALVPDVVPPRWPNHTQLTAVQRVRPLPAATWLNDPTDFDDPDSLAAVPAPFAVLLSRIAPAQRSPARIIAGLHSLRAHRHIFAASILTTGPPRV